MHSSVREKECRDQTYTNCSSWLESNSHVYDFPIGQSSLFCQHNQSAHKHTHWIESFHQITLHLKTTNWIPWKYLYPTRAICPCPDSVMFIKIELVIMFTSSQKSACQELTNNLDPLKTQWKRKFILHIHSSLAIKIKNFEGSYNQKYQFTLLKS